MNRQQKRREQREKLKELNKVHKVTALQLETIKEVERRAARNEYIDVVLGYLFTLPVIALSREFGFGKKRLQKFNDLVTDLLDEVQREKLDLNELMEKVRRDYGIGFKND